MISIIAQARAPAPAAPTRGGARPAAGAGARPRTSSGLIVAVVSWILVGVGTTIIYGFWQMSWLFSLLEDVMNVLVPGRGTLFRWLMLIVFFILASTVSLGIGGGKKSQFPDPITGKPLMVYPELPTVLFKITLYYIAVIILPIMFGKPLIANWVVQPIINGLVSIDQTDVAVAIVTGAQKAGMDINLPSVEAEKSIEDRLCGGYTKFDEQGNVIKGGKQIDVGIEAPPWSSGGSFYRATLTIQNLANEPLKVIVNKGHSPIFHKKGDETTTVIKQAEGSFITGKDRIEEISGKDIDRNYLLTPLNCLEPNGCVVEPGLDRTVELISSEKVSFKDRAVATLNVELKVSYDKDEKGRGTGYLLLFKDRQDAVARQKDSNFKTNYCPNTFSGPLDVVVTPPFYTVGSTSDGGDGYFKFVTEEQCPTDIEEFRIERGYCIQNVKNVKVKLVNTDENAEIKVRSIKILPFKVGGDFPEEYTNIVNGKLPIEVTLEEGGTGFGNCYLESLGTTSNGIIFEDEKGVPSNPLEAVAPILKEHTYLCRYQINDFPPGFSDYRITDFKAYQFQAEVEYDYIATFTKGNILMEKSTGT